MVSLADEGHNQNTPEGVTCIECWVLVSIRRPNGGVVLLGYGVLQVVMDYRFICEIERDSRRG